MGGGVRKGEKKWEEARGKGRGEELTLHIKQ